MKRKLIKIQKNKSAYFAGDFHLGKPDFKISHERELKLIRWFDYIKKMLKRYFLWGIFLIFGLSIKT